MLAPLLRRRGTRKAYGTTPVPDGVAVDVAAGGFVALVGQSGSGKTTLLNTIDRLVEPDVGAPQGLSHEQR